MRWALLLLGLLGLPAEAQVLGGSDNGQSAGTAPQDSFSNPLGGEDTAPLQTVCDIAQDRGALFALFNGTWTGSVLPGVIQFDGSAQASDPVDGIAIQLNPEARTARFEGEPLNARLMSRRAPLIFEEGQAYVALQEARQQQDPPPCAELDLPRIRVTGQVQQGEQTMEVTLYLEAVTQTDLLGVIVLEVTAAGSSEASVAVHPIIARR